MCEFNLTNGQMIDQMVVGQVYQNEIGARVVIKNGDFRYVDEELAIVQNLGINGYYSPIKGRKWKLVPKYVSWETAYSALKRGATIKSHMDTMKDWTYRIGEDGKNPNIDLDRIMHGKWTIEVTA